MSVAIKQNGGRVYFVGDTFPVKDKIKKIGGKWDGDAKCWWVSISKLQAAVDLAKSINEGDQADQKPKASDVKVYGKCKWNGRKYYIIAKTRNGDSTRIAGLPSIDGRYFDKWVKSSELEDVVEFKPVLKWNGVRGRGSREIESYQTLEGIARFINKQKRAEELGLPKCYICGKASSKLVNDLETGLLACRSCADMPE